MGFLAYNGTFSLYTAYNQFNGTYNISNSPIDYS